MVVLLVLVLALWLFQFDVRAGSVRLFAWTRDLGPMGLAVFMLVYAALILLLIPTAFLTLGAGVLFGVAVGSICVVVATTAGSVLAFLLGRYGFSDNFSHYVRSHPKLQAVDTELVHQGFKIILLTRLTPFFPGKLSNYFFGVARFNLADFFWGTLVGIIPFSVLNVYLGALAGDLAVLDPNALARSPLAWMAVLVGVAAAAALIHYIARAVRHALKGSLEKNAGMPGAD